MSQDGDIEEKVVVSTNVAKVREVIARPRKVGSGVPGALRGRRELVLAPRVLQHALPDVATLLKDSMPSALGPCKKTAHELAQATKKRVIGENEDKRQNAVQPDSALKPHEAAQPQHECPVCRQMFEDMFDLTFHARTHNGPARSYSRARKAPKSPAVLHDTGHQTQMNRKQTHDTFTLKPNGHSGKQVPDVSELASTAVSHSGYKNESLMQDIVTVKEDSEDIYFEKGVSPEAAQMGLYKDHQIKDELVLGPVLLQARDVACIVQNNIEKEPTSTVDSSAANNKGNETVSQDSVTLKVDPEERCFDEEMTEAIQVDHLEYKIKDELVRDERCFEESVSPEVVEIGLYKDHLVNNELILGPNLLQPRDVDFIVHHNNEQDLSTVENRIANNKETVTVKVEPRERCFDEGVMEAIRVDHLEYQIKDKLVMRPVLQQSENVALIEQNNNKQKLTIKLDRPTQYNESMKQGAETVKNEPEERSCDKGMRPEATQVDNTEYQVCNGLVPGPVLLQPRESHGVACIEHSKNQPELTNSMNNLITYINESMMQGTVKVKEESDERSSDLTGSVVSPTTHMNASTMRGRVTIKEEPEERCCNESVSPEPAEVGLFVEHQTQECSIQAQILCQQPDFAFMSQTMPMPTDAVLKTIHNSDQDRKHSKDSLHLTFNKPPLKTYSRASKLSEKQPKLTEAVDSPVPTAHSEDLEQESVIVSVKEEPEGVEEHKIQTGLNDNVEEVPENGSGIALKEETQDFEVDKEVRLEASRSELYEDHEVKDELVLGPETLHPPDVFYTFPGQNHASELAKPDTHTESTENPEGRRLSESKADKKLPVTSILFQHGLDDAVLVVVPSHESSQPSSTDQSKYTYKCDDCGKGYRKKAFLKKHIQNHLRKHVMLHTGAKPFICSQCSYTCRKKSRLIYHQRTHTTEKPLKCNHCNYSTSYKSYLRHHLNKHTGQMPNKCSFCNYKCSQKSYMKIHQRIHTDEKPYKCNHCDYTCRHKSNLAVHLIKHTGESYKCNHCNYTTNFKSALRHHLMKHTGEMPYKCNFCDYKCSRKHHMTSHQRIHTGEKPFGCSLCDFSTSHKSTLRHHVMKHTGDKPYNCNFCEYKCSRKPDMTIHQRIHTDEKPYKCNLCDYKSSQKHHMTSHQRIHTGEKPFGCSLCDFSTSHKSTLRLHVMKHTGDMPYNCNFCDYKCSRKQVMTIHQRIHTDEKPYKCNLCDYKSSQKHHMTNHQRIHTGEKPFGCSHCDFSTSHKSTLRLHVMKHTGDMPYNCNFCDYKCSRKQVMTIHQRIHTDEKPYKCNLCDYKSRQKHHMINHQRIHTGEKPFGCSLCDYSTSNKSTLRHHLMKHTGEMPYKCNLCDYKSSQKFYMTIHQRIHTGEKPFKCSHCDYSSRFKGDATRHQLSHMIDKPFKCSHCDFATHSQGSLQRHQNTHTRPGNFKCVYCVFTHLRKDVVAKHQLEHHRI